MQTYNQLSQEDTPFMRQEASFIFRKQVKAIAIVALFATVAFVGAYALMGNSQEEMTTQDALEFIDRVDIDDEDHEWGWSGWKKKLLRYRRKKRCRGCAKAVKYMNKKPMCKRRVYLARQACLHKGKVITYCGKYGMTLPKTDVPYRQMAKQGFTYSC